MAIDKVGINQLPADWNIILPYISTTTSEVVKTILDKNQKPIYLIEDLNDKF